MSTLNLQKVSKSFKSGDKELAVLKNVSFELKAGESVAIIGASGSGKSTLLHLAGLMDAPESGQVLIHGKEVINEAQRTHHRRHSLGFIFQHHHLQREFNVLENVALPARLAGVQDANKRAQDLLAEIGLGERLHHLPSQLSGGERQRVAIARALINEPDFILADEPTGSLDNTTAEKVADVLFNLTKRHQTGLLLVTHNQTLAKRCQKRFKLAAGKLTKA